MKLFLFSFFLCMTVAASAQKDTILPAYKRYPTLPPLQLLLGDSTTKYTKANLPAKKPVLLIIFSPDCEHCQHEAEALMARKADFKDVQIVMATPLAISKMKAFDENYHLSKEPNIVVGRDIYYLLPGFYEIRNLPFMALYDKKGNLLTTFEGSVGLDKVLEAFDRGK